MHSALECFISIIEENKLMPEDIESVLTRLLQACDVKAPDGGIAPPDAGSLEGGLPEPAGDGRPPGDDGCGCRLGWRPPASPLAPLALLVLLVLRGVARRRRGN